MTVDLLDMKEWSDHSGKPVTHKHKHLHVSYDIVDVFINSFVIFSDKTVRCWLA